MIVTLIKFTDGDGDNLIVTDVKDANMATVSKEQCSSMEKFGDLASKHGFVNGLSETKPNADGISTGWRAFKPATVEW